MPDSRPQNGPSQLTKPPLRCFLILGQGPEGVGNQTPFGKAFAGCPSVTRRPLWLLAAQGELSRPGRSERPGNSRQIAPNTGGNHSFREYERQLPTMGMAENQTDPLPFLRLSRSRGLSFDCSRGQQRRIGRMLMAQGVCRSRREVTIPGRSWRSSSSRCQTRKCGETAQAFERRPHESPRVRKAAGPVDSYR